MSIEDEMQKRNSLRDKFERTPVFFHFSLCTDSHGQTYVANQIVPEGIPQPAYMK